MKMTLSNDEPKKMTLSNDKPKTTFIPQGYIVKVLLDTVSTFPVQSYPVSCWSAPSLPPLEVNLLIVPLLLQLVPPSVRLAVDPQH